MRFKIKATVAAIALMLPAVCAMAQSVEVLKAAAQRAVLTNPEVTARYNAYRAAIDAVDVARAAYLPRVDLGASVGYDNDRITSRGPESQSLNRNGVNLSLTQLLWDGLGTQRDVERFSHDKLTRYFELLDTTEQTTLEATRAAYDVQRFRRLVQLAEDNYVQHKYVSLQIQSRFRAGVGRGVDLEQANARLALAESNLTTETSNLHDVTARYERVVGEAPPRQLPPMATLGSTLTGNAEDITAKAISQNASVSASIENLRSARAAAQVRETAFQPRIEARLRSGGGKNFDGIRDQKRDSSAEILLTWNLYNGGADQARLRQQLNLVNVAADQRDKACRDTRQTAMIAFNDTRKLVEQIQYLDRNTLAIEKARDAYRQQFDISQRSLLDLLNAENEVYTAQRAYANAEYDLAIAYVRTFAAMNQLTTLLGIARVDNAATEIASWSVGDDAPTRCPVLTVEVPTINREELDARAQRIAASAPPPPAPVPAAPVRRP